MRKFVIREHDAFEEEILKPIDVVEPDPSFDREIDSLLDSILPTNDATVMWALQHSPWEQLQRGVM